MIRIAEVRILTTSLGTPRGELRVHERAEQRDDASGNPGAEDERGGVNLPRYHVGVDEDPAADDAAHHDHRGVEWAEPASEVGHAVTESRKPYSASSRRPAARAGWPARRRRRRRAVSRDRET